MWRVSTLLVLLVLGGCGTSDDRDQARATVERFYDAIRAQDGEAACAQLTATTSEALEDRAGQECRAVITRLDYGGGAVVGTEVYVTNAKVDLRDDESAFLEREPEGWRISAVGCRSAEGRPRSRPFECEAES
jgi:hypothetical protein